MVSSEILDQPNELRQNRKANLEYRERSGRIAGEGVSKVDKRARKEADHHMKQIHQGLRMRSELISQKEIRKADKIKRNEEKLDAVSKHVPSIGLILRFRDMREKSYLSWNGEHAEAQKEERDWTDEGDLEFGQNHLSEWAVKPQIKQGTDRQRVNYI